MGKIVKKIKSYVLVALFLGSFSLLAQNDNDLIPKDDVYYIQSAINYGKNNGGFWDLPGEKNFAVAQKFSVWEFVPEKKKRRSFQDGKFADRKYKFLPSKNSEYIKIRLSTVRGFVDVAGGRNANGTSIQLYNENNTSSQNYRFKYVNNGHFKIYNENGKVLQLESRSSKNGKKIILWDDHKGAHTEWVLISDKTRKALILPDKKEITSRKKDWADMGGIGRFIIQSANNFGKNDGGCFDIPGNSNPKKGDNLKVWSLDKGTDRIYSLTQAKNKAYYNVVVGASMGDDLVVDVAGNGYRNGTNVGVWERNNYHSQDFYFKHLGKGRYKIYNRNGKILCLDNRSSKNGSNIHMWVDHDGSWTEWYLLDADTRKVFIPYPVPVTLSGIKEGTLPGPESRALSANINDTYSEVHKTDVRIKALNEKAGSARKALKRTKSASNGINDLNGRVNRTRESLAIFQRLPIIGTPVSVLAVSLDKVKGKLNKANASVKKLEKTTLGPTLNSAYKLNEAMYTIERSLVAVNQKLLTTKVNFNKAATCVTNSNNASVISTFESKSKAANTNLTKVNNSLDDINKSITELEKIVKSVSKLNGQLGPLEIQIKNIDKAFKESDKVAKEIDKVLSKRFKKKIAGKTVVDISLKKALNGGKKYTKKITKFINKWIGKAIDPIIKKLKIKIPGVNIDGLKKELKNLNKSSKLLSDQANKVVDYSNNLMNMKNKLDVSFDDCLNVPPCKFNKDVDLTAVALVETDVEGARSDPTKPLPTKIDLIPNLNFTEGNYNNIFNISSQLPLEVRTAKVGDAVDDLFDQTGLTSANSRKADVYTGFGFVSGSPMQRFHIKHQGKGYYSIYNERTKTALTVVGSSKEEGANVVPQKWTGKDNQLFLIIRDTEKYRYAAFIIAKHSGMALGIGKHGSVVQQKLNTNDKAQIWAFSNRMVWQNSAGLLGVNKLSLATENATISDNGKTASWNYIAHPSYKNAYYIMNVNSTRFLQSEEVYDKNNLAVSYNLVQAPYVAGTKALMLFYMNYADEAKQKINLIEVFTKYIVDVDETTNNLELVTATSASSLAGWNRFTTIKDAIDSMPSIKKELTGKQKELVALLKTMEILKIEDYLKNTSTLDYLNADNIGGEKYESLLAKTMNSFSIDDRVQLITGMVRGASQNKDKMTTTAILSAFTEIDFSQTNNVVEPFKDIAQQSIRDIAEKIKSGMAKTYINKLIHNLD